MLNSRWAPHALLRSQGCTQLAEAVNTRLPLTALPCLLSPGCGAKFKAADGGARQLHATTYMEK